MNQPPDQTAPEPKKPASDGSIVASAWLLRYFLPALVVFVGFIVKQQGAQQKQSDELNQQAMQLQAQMKKDIEEGHASEVELRLLGVSREEYEQKRHARQKPPDTSREQNPTSEN